MAEYKKITSKGGINLPVRLRREMGLEPGDPVELFVTAENKLQIGQYQTRCIFCSNTDVMCKIFGKGVCAECAAKIKEG